MQMNPRDYYDSFVKPNYDEFCADEGDVRKAYNAIISLNHMADNYFNYYQRRNDPRVSGCSALKDFQIYLSSNNAYYNDVQSMANAYKHLYTNSGRAHVTVNSGGAVFVDEAEPDDDVTQSDDLKKKCWHIVYYSKNDGSCAKVKDALAEIIKMWESIL